MCNFLKPPHRDEYLFLREEIMLRVGWHIEYAKVAISMTIPVWAFCFAFMAYAFTKDSSTEIIYFISVSILFLPILILCPLSFKIYENYAKVCIVATYLITFHEKPLNENDGKFFSWEIANAALGQHFRKNIPNITKALDQSSDDLTYLSITSLLLILVISIVCSIYRDANYYYSIITLVLVILGGLLIKFVIHKYSSYKNLVELLTKIETFWDDYKLFLAV